MSVGDEVAPQAFRLAVGAQSLQAHLLVAGENVEPQFLVSIRSEPLAAAPLLTVPPMLEGPGMVPSMPTMLIALPAAFLNPFTRKMLIWLPGCESVKSRLSGLHGVSSSMLMLALKSGELFTHGCMSYRVTFPMQIPARA